jgi:hypothetical protein
MDNRPYPTHCLCGYEFNWGEAGGRMMASGIVKFDHVGCWAVQFRNVDSRRSDGANPAQRG